MMYGWWGHMYNWGNSYGWGNTFGIGGFAMMFSMLLFWALIIAGIVYAVRALSGNGAPLNQGRENSALDILKERYARGEIDSEEYRSKRQQLAG